MKQPHMTPLRKWTITLDSYEGPQVTHGIDDEMDDSDIEVVEIPDRLRESLEQVFLYARDRERLDTWTLLPVAQLLRALGWSPDEESK